MDIDTIYPQPFVSVVPVSDRRFGLYNQGLTVNTLVGSKRFPGAECADFMALKEVSTDRDLGKSHKV